MDDLAALARVSAELGRNRLLIQAAGGNTSVKADGVLWVKASGRRPLTPCLVPLASL